MKPITVTAAALIAVSAVGILNQGSLKDKTGRFSIQNFTSGSIRRNKQDKSQSFRVKGNPVIITTKPSGPASVSMIVAKAPEAAGTAVDSGNGLELQQATLSGGMTIEATQPQGKSTISGQQGDFKQLAEKAVITVTPKCTAVVTRPQTTLNVAGAKSVFTLMGKLAQAEKNRDYTLDVDGPCSMDYHQAGATSKGVPTKTNVHATGDHLSATPRQIKLDGHVHLTGNDPTLFGESTFDSVVIDLDEAGEILEINYYGNPGTAIIAPAPGGGGRKR
ncbi:MAG: hypothetical protein JSS72_02325 [Armatimonadetes bacterium]|nr:hypothetical protein [Armatimonadota bacterium]